MHAKPLSMIMRRRRRATRLRLPGIQVALLLASAIQYSAAQSFAPLTYDRSTYLHPACIPVSSQCRWAARLPAADVGHCSGIRTVECVLRSVGDGLTAV